jgi:hypothetical protein
MKRVLFLSAIIIGLIVSANAASIEFINSALWNNIRDIEAQNGRLYCAYVQGLQIYDASHPKSLKPLGQLFLKGWCDEIAVSGKLVFLAECYEGLPIIDISNPKAPKLLAMYDSLDYVTSVSAFGDLVFAGDTTGILHIIDTSEPQRPRRLCQYKVEGEVLDVALKGNYAFLAVGTEGIIGYNGGYLQVLDISDLAHPSVLGSYYSKSCAGAVLVEDSLVYLVDGIQGLQILKFESPDNIIMLGQAKCYTGESKADLLKIGSCIYISRYDGGFCVYDITDPLAPKLIENSGTPLEPENHQPRSMRICSAGQYAYLTGLNPEITTLDIKNPWEPKAIGFYGTISNVKDIVAQGKYAYVIDNDEGLFIVDISKPDHPSYLAKCPIAGECEAIAVSKKIALIAKGLDGIDLIDISNPKKPIIMGSFKEKDHPKEIRGAFIRGNLAYLTGFLPGAIILDISDPQNPTQIGRLKGTTDVNDIFFRGDRAYLASEYSGLQIFDLADPLNPVFLGSYDTQYAKAVAVSGNHAFIADGVDGFIIVDISQPDDIREVAVYKTSGEKGALADLQFADVSILGNTAFLLTEMGNREVIILDISDLTHPALLAEYGPIEFAEHFVVQDDLIFVPDWSNLIVLRYLR